MVQDSGHNYSRRREAQLKGCMMKMRRKLIPVAVTMLLALVFASPIYALSKPGEYSGYSEPIYNEVVLSSQYITVRDGTKLAIDIYRPAVDGEPVSEKLPLLFANSRYQRGGDTILFMWTMIGMETLVKHGYVVAVMDPRGAGASYGSREGEFGEAENLDVYEVIEWLAGQDWCNGRIAMFGGSYLGVTQFMIAGKQPPHLEAITPVVANIDMYKFLYPNGVMNTLFYYMLDGMTKALDLLVPAQPVDEDPSGVMMEEARLQHLNNLWMTDVFYLNMFRDSWDERLGNKPCIATSPIGHINEIGSSGISIYQMGGWFDEFPGEQLGGFKLWGDKILIGPWEHFEMYSPEAAQVLAVEHLRWYDHILKGIENGIMDEPPVYYYTMGAPAGKEWRFASDWPLPSQKLTNYYFIDGPSGTVDSVKDGILSTQPPATLDAKDDYTVDYSIKVFGGAYDRMARHYQADMTEDVDKKGLTYTTDPLEGDMEVTGHPVAHLWVNSTASDGYFLIYLEEVDQDGFSRYVTDGVMRASHRALGSQAPWDEMGVPYHRSYEEDYSPLPGVPTELVFDLFPVSYVFHKGNRLRITITCSDQDTYQFPEGLMENPAPVVSIYRDASHPSSIVLPVIPSKPTLFEGIAEINASGKSYAGPAELYAFQTSVYLHFGDRWLKWDAIKNWQKGSVEQYKCEGESGKLSVLVQYNSESSFGALATGQGVHFKGEPK
jgi:putative CocE/NonD family hydrolase